LISRTASCFVEVATLARSSVGFSFPWHHRLARPEPLAIGIRSPKKWPAERGWVRFLSEVQRRPEFDLVEISKAASDLGLRRVYTLLGKQLRHVPDAVLRQRYLITMSQIVHGLPRLTNCRNAEAVRVSVSMSNARSKI
jgi:hypothetical protein